MRTGRQKRYLLRQEGAHRGPTPRPNSPKRLCFAVAGHRVPRTGQEDSEPRDPDSPPELAIWRASVFNRGLGFRGGKEEGSQCLAEDGLPRAMEKSQEWSPQAPGAAHGRGGVLVQGHDGNGCAGEGAGPRLG